MDKEEFSMALGSGIRLISEQKQAGMVIREQSKSAYGAMLDGHLQAFAAIASMLNRYNMVPGSTNDSISHRLALVASFVQGVDPCETAISEGLYFQAAALLRQKLETIAALHEVGNCSRTNKKTPNVKHVPWNLGQMYGELSRATHVADSELLSIAYGAKGHVAADGRVPTSLIPQFDRSVARGLYGLHLALVVQLGLKLHELFIDMYGSGFVLLEWQFLQQAVVALETEGWLQKSL